MVRTKPRDPVRDAELLAAIIATPDDDAPRLVYADWLMELGDPLGEYIAANIALQTLCASTPDYLSDPRYEKLFARNDKTWTKAEKSIGAAVRRYATHWSYERGFVQELHTNGSKLIAGYEVILNHVPAPRIVIENLDRRDLAELAEVSLGRFAAIEFGADCELDGAAIARIVGSPAIHGLRHLDVGGNPIGDTGAIAIAGSPHLATLESLSIMNCGLTDAAIDALLASTTLRLARLQVVSTYGNPALTAAAKQRLAAKFPQED